MPKDTLLQGLKELGTFLGGKVDTIMKSVDELTGTLRRGDLFGKIEVDLTSRAVEKLQEEKNVNINRFAEELKGASSTQEKALLSLIPHLQQLSSALVTDNQSLSNLKELQPLLGRIVSELQSVEKSVVNQKDNTTHELLRRTIRAVERIKIDKPDNRDIIKALTSVERAVNKLPPPVLSNRDVVMAIGGMGKKIDNLISRQQKFPSTIKLDHMQVSQMAQGGSAVSTREDLVPKGYEQLAVTGTAGGFASVPDGADKAIIVVLNSDIRWRDDGTVPTASVGVFWQRRSYFELTGRSSINAFRAIRTASPNAELNISYYQRQ